MRGTYASFSARQRKGLAGALCAALIALSVPLVVTGAGAAPSDTVVVTGLSAPYASAFDSVGDMYIAGGDDDSIDRVPAAQLSAAGPATATTVATVTGARLVGLAFDPAGDLFFLRQTGNSIYELTAAQLAGSLPATPTVFTTVPGTHGGDVVFDGAGDMFVSNENYVYEFTASQLMSGSPVASVVAHVGTDIDSLALDEAGDLFFSDFGTGDVSEVTAAQIALGTTVTAPLVIYDAGVNDAWGVVFDGAGNLYLAQTYDDAVTEITAAQLASNTAPYPATTYAHDAALNLPVGLTYHDDSLYVTNYGGNTVNEFNVTPAVSRPSPVSGLAVSETTGSLSATWNVDPSATTYTCTLLFAFNDPSLFTVTTTSTTCSFSVDSSKVWGISVTATNAAGSSSAVAAFGTPVKPSKTVTSIACTNGRHSKRVYGSPPKCPHGWWRR